MNDLPKTWWSDEIDGDGWVLVGRSWGALHLLAPPGVRCQSGEAAEDRAMWRHAVWMSNDDMNPPAARVDVPDAVDGLQTREVVEMLPTEHHDFVRKVMARQICRAATLGVPAAGQCRDELYSRGSGRVVAWVTAQLADAFPSESWFREEIGSVAVPDTINELLHELPAAPAKGRESGWLSRHFSRSRRWRPRHDGFFSWSSLTYVAVSVHLHNAFSISIPVSKPGEPRPPGPECERVDDAQVH